MKYIMERVCVKNAGSFLLLVQSFTFYISFHYPCYVKLALDEPVRLARLDGTNKISLLEKYKQTENDATALCAQYGLLSPIYGHCRRNGCWFCPNASDAELRHILTHHPKLFEQLLQWEQEDNLFHRRITRTETPSEVKARLLADHRVGCSIS